MKNSIRTELIAHINECPKEEQSHFRLFNEDYYIIGYYKAEQWLKEHDLNTFEAIAICNEFEQDNFGEIQTQFENAEKLVNHLVYWYGQNLCNELKISNE